MSGNRKLSFLGNFAKSEPNGILGRRYLEKQSSSNIFEIIDERFYVNGKINFK
jgi:hypothetical protein